MDKVHSVQELIERTKDMPLERMRFFINEDRREPKCFGIYREEYTGHWVVYKNKANGSRAVRYSGPDEAYAAQELWAKIQSEIELRRGAEPAPVTRESKRRDRLIAWAVLAVIVAAVVCFAVVAVILDARAPSRGYYLVDDDIYYYQNSYWYYYDGDGWNDYDAPDGEEWYDDAYYGESYPYFDGTGDGFEDSDYYREPDFDSDDGDSDAYGGWDSGIFDSWDSGGTDWNSDW